MCARKVVFFHSTDYSDMNQYYYHDVCNCWQTHSSLIACTYVYFLVMYTYNISQAYFQFFSNYNLRNKI